MSKPEPHPKGELHDAIQTAFHEERVAGAATGGLVTRWVMAVELMLPNNERAFVRLSSTASGEPLVSWDAIGLLGKGLALELREDLPRRAPDE